MFVLEIDDYAYQFFTTDLQKAFITGLPPMGYLANDKSDFPDDHPDKSHLISKLDDALWQTLSGIALAPILIGIATAIYQGWCGDDALGFGLPAACIFACCFAAKQKDI